MTQRRDPSDDGPTPHRTADRRYIVVRGRLWRAANPNLPAEVLAGLKSRLGKARSDVAKAKREGDDALLKDARRRVQAAKEGLGERGPVWWDDGEPDYNRHLVKNTPYAAESGED